MTARRLALFACLTGFHLLLAFWSWSLHPGNVAAAPATRAWASKAWTVLSFPLFWPALRLVELNFWTAMVVNSALWGAILAAVTTTLLARGTR